MTIKRLLAIGFIFLSTSAAWYLLGGALTMRTKSMNQRLVQEVIGNWGAPMIQHHPTAYYLSPTSGQSQRLIQPRQSRINVSLHYDPKKKGLLRFRTYRVQFDAQYWLKNPTPIKQTLYLRFALPVEGVRYDDFKFRIGSVQTDKSPKGGVINESAILEPGEEVLVQVAYYSTGMNRWLYDFDTSSRLRGFLLQMDTDFMEINIPTGAESPTSRQVNESGWELLWDYTNVIGARAVGMDMPSVVNPGPVAARMTFFAPVSLLFFFTVLLIVGVVRGVGLHPMNYFFLAAGCFTFQLVFAYLVDLVSTFPAFLISAMVSLGLVTVYLCLVTGIAFARLSAISQFAFMVLFSYSFFFPGLTGITITVGSVITLALLMIMTAKVNWAEVFERKSARKETVPAKLRSSMSPPPLHNVDPNEP